MDAVQLLGNDGVCCKSNLFAGNATSRVCKQKVSSRGFVRINWLLFTPGNYGGIFGELGRS
jgi:hypothetical protein